MEEYKKGKTRDDYASKLEGAQNAPHAAYKPANKGTEEAYNPQDFTMKHDSVFSELVPTVVSSGNLAHKWGGEGEHWSLEEPPADIKSE